MPKSFLSYATLSVFIVTVMLVLKAIFGSFSPAVNVGYGYQEYDLTAVPEGTYKMERFGNKHVILIHRSREQQKIARSQLSALKEVPFLNRSGVQDVEISEENLSISGHGKYLVFYNTNPTRGCVLIYGAGDYDAWFDPCAGGHWDMNGIARKGPGDANLRIPRYVFTPPYSLMLIPDNAALHVSEHTFNK